MWRFVPAVILSSPENRNSWIQQEGLNGSRRSMAKRLKKRIDLTSSNLLLSILSPDGREYLRPLPANLVVSFLKAHTQH
jgi:hypothetical protein